MPQSFFPITPVQLTDPLVNYNWADIDLSPYIPAGASGAIVYIRNTAAAVREWGIRCDGSTDDLFGAMSGDSHCWGIVGVANRIFEWKNTNAFVAKCYVTLIGYTMPPGVIMYVNGVSFTSGMAAGAWHSRDLNFYAGVPTDAVGAIVEVWGGVPIDHGLRMRGSTDNRIDVTGNRRNQFTAIIGIEADPAASRVEAYCGAIGSPNCRVLGYITEGATFYENAIDMTPPAVGAWGLCPNVVPANSVLAFIEIAGCDVAPGCGLREYPGGFGQLGAGNCHPWGITRCNSLGQVEGQRGAVGQTFWMTGYAHFMPPAAQTDPATGVS